MKPLIVSCHTRPVIMVKYNKDGDLFFTASFDGKVNAFWTEPVERLGSYQCEGAVRGISISEDSKYLIAGTAVNGIYIFEVETGKQLKKIMLPVGQLRELEFSMGSSEFFVINYESSKKQSVVYIFETQNALTVTEPRKKDLTRRDTDPYYRGAWGYLNKTLVLGTTQGTIEVLDSKTGMTKQRSDS